jgi:membrane dipeptidase
VCDHVRNVPDDVLRQLPGNGGIVMITFVPAFVSQEVWDAARPYWEEYKRRVVGVEDATERERIYEEVMAPVTLPRATLSQVADHVEHVRKVAGVDHVGLGGDFDGSDRMPEGLEDVSKYPALFAELIRRGWKDEDLKKLAGKNLLRVMRQAEAAAQRAQKARRPSLATLESLDRQPAAPTQMP